MKVLIIGSGGREHALAWKLQKDSEKKKETVEIFCAPGNGGTAGIAKNVQIAATAIDELLRFAQTEKIDFTIVGMENPLALGIVDLFTQQGLKIFGPSQKAAQLEASKVFSKAFMKKYHIPTASAEAFSSLEAAQAYCSEKPLPFVIKADGLAVGKGVSVCHERETATDFLKALFTDKIFGKAGETIIVEDFLEGQEVTVLAFVDGKNYQLMPAAQDHKQAFDGDKGPNTGGMGAYAPCSIFTEEIEEIVRKEIFTPTIQGLSNEGTPFVGFLYVGLMITHKGPYVIEYNVRMGDPETQVILPLLATPLLEILDSTLNGTLDTLRVRWKDSHVVAVVAASGGYPANDYEKGFEINGDMSEREDSLIFQAGTRSENDKLLTAGGRVFAVVGIGKSRKEAADIAYRRLKDVSFKNMFYRKDIGARPES